MPIGLIYKGTIMQNPIPIQELGKLNMFIAKNLVWFAAIIGGFFYLDYKADEGHENLGYHAGVPEYFWQSTQLDNIDTKIIELEGQIDQLQAVILEIDDPEETTQQQLRIIDIRDRIRGLERDKQNLLERNENGQAD